MAALAWLAGCAHQAPPAQTRPEDVRAQIVTLLPADTADRTGWAADIYAAFSTLHIEPSTSNLCAAIAVAQQESSLQVDPAVPHLGEIALKEIDRRAEKAGVPTLLVHGALQLHSPDGRSYSERIAEARTEKDLSNAFDDFIGMVPLGQRLFGNYNPVRTAGPMQVSVEFAEQQVQRRTYPYPLTGSIRHELFTRRGGLYFGIAHLLDYPAHYDAMIYRFADFNAGRYASRNAAFQAAVSDASGMPLAPDGDLLRRGADADRPSSTELALRTLARRLDMSESAIRRDLAQQDDADFDETRLHRRVFELAEQAEHRALPRAMLPRIDLHGPKIARSFSTERFARRVDERHRRCMARAG